MSDGGAGGAPPNVCVWRGGKRTGIVCVFVSVCARTRACV